MGARGEEPPERVRLLEEGDILGLLPLERRWRLLIGYSRFVLVVFPGVNSYNNYPQFYLRC